MKYKITGLEIKNKIHQDTKMKVNLFELKEINTNIEDKN